MNRLTSVIKTCTASIGSINAKADIFCALRLSSSQLSTLSNQSRTENKPLNFNARNLLSQQCLTASAIIPSGILLTIEPMQTLQLVRHKWTSASGRVGKGPRGNNGKRSPLTIQGAFQTHAYKKKFKKTLSRRFAGHVDVFNRKGERDPLVAAEERYKRLDWGWYIGTRVGRFNKMWAKTDYENWRDEQHVSLSKDANKKLEKMFSPEAKRPRYFPDDPYEKYNTKVNFWKYRAGLLKNKELIRKYGNPVYRFDRYQAHMKRDSDENIKSNLLYAPPGYLETIGNNPSGTYIPDPETAFPRVETAPHFQRKRLREPPVMPKRAGGQVKAGRGLPQDYKKLRAMEMYAKQPIPLWSPINFPTIHEQ